MKTRQAIVELAQSWLGKNEADGSHREIIDIYNARTLRPRGYKVTYTDAWCATFVSALAIKLGYTDIIPVECSCSKLIELAKAMGIWQEKDSVTPQMGDLILYDWQDSGKGDNTGNPDHVGLVESIGSNNTFDVIEGNYSNSVKRRNIAINGKNIRGFICPKYDAFMYTDKKPAQPTTKSVTDVAKEVVAGKWGNGADRKKKLEAAGYNYAQVQAAVNKLVNGSKTPSKSVEEVAKEVIRGKWGNGADRKKRLEAAGYNYAQVQAVVNRLL